MPNALYDTGREGFLAGEIDADTATIKAALIRGYTFSAAHKFVNPGLTGGTIDATSGALASVAITNGVFGSADLTWTAVSNGSLAIPAIVLFQSSLVGGGGDTAATGQRLIAYIDGKIFVTCAANASASATSVTIDPLVAPLANGSTVVFGAVTATLTSSAALGARTLAVSALSGSIAQGVIGTSSAQGGLPITPTGGNITYQVDATSGNKWFKL